MKQQLQLDGQDTDRISGYVNSILFSNEANGYKVIDIESEDGLELITAVGILPDIEIGEKIEASGKWSQHSTYGEQFSIREYYRSVPTDVESMARYLGSGVIKGVGEALAGKIVDMFGEDTFRVIENEPELLSRIKGISDKKACEIGEQFAAKAASREAMVYLQGLGLTPTMSMRVFEVLGNKTVDLVQRDPYIMAERVDGISFRKADEIARKAGIPLDSPARVRSAIRYVLLEASGMGHSFLPRSVMEEWVYSAIGIGGDLVDTAYEQALMSGAIIGKTDEDEESVYLRSLYTAETGAARHIAELLEASEAGSKSETEEGISEKLLGRIRGIENEKKITLSEEQKKAIAWAYEKGLVIITGGPGTGKTTIIEVLLELLDQDGCLYQLAAPTGKAAKRMEEATGREAKTLHRLLEVQGLSEAGGRMVFNRNAENPLEHNYLIIDEMSMVDITLLYHFLEAVVPGTHVVFLGDKDQLPSVGPGNVLRDLIESEALPVCRLTHIYRQGSESGIVHNAHRINNGQYPVFDNKHTDFFMMRTLSAEQTLKTMCEVIKVRFPKFFPCDYVEDIQVLSPMKKGILGVHSLNEQLQSVLNPKSPLKQEKQSGETLFRVGDKVMQTRNNYEMEWRIENRYHVSIEEGKGVFNGDTGRVDRIDKEGVVVRFDGGRMVTYDNSSLAQLELAYAITIHKSQGTESPVIVLPLFEGPDVLMTRNLLYTAVTRARKYVVIIGKEETIRRMVDHDQQSIRYSMLPERIRGAVSLFRTDTEYFDSVIPLLGAKRKAPEKISIDSIASMMEEETGSEWEEVIFRSAENTSVKSEDGKVRKTAPEEKHRQKEGKYNGKKHPSWPDLDIDQSEFDPDKWL